MKKGIQVCEMFEVDPFQDWITISSNGIWDHFEEEEKKEGNGEVKSDEVGGDDGNSSSSAISLIPDKSNPHLSPTFLLSISSNEEVECYFELWQPSRFSLIVLLHF